MKQSHPLVLALLALLASASCSEENSGPPESDDGTGVRMILTSTAFDDGSRIPVLYTCEGGDSSPALQWTGVPDSARSLALVVDDPDAPTETWVHWVLYNVPPTLNSMPEGIPTTDTLANGSRHGTNSFRRLGYGGPCPPRGHGAHRYVFRLYALDMLLDLAPGAKKEAVLEAMEEHVLATAQLMGTYSRE
jgi:Raf kinase inhibitor-like YbhB/YbcL family protein